MPKHANARVAAAMAAVLSLAFTAPRAQEASASAAEAAFCVECIQVRVGLPKAARGPAPGISDNPLSEIQLGGRRFRGFSASATTYAIDGATPSDMGGAARPVMSPAPRGQDGVRAASGSTI